MSITKKEAIDLILETYVDYYLKIKELYKIAKGNTNSEAMNIQRIYDELNNIYVLNNNINNFWTIKKKIEESLAFYLVRKNNDELYDMLGECKELSDGYNLKVKDKIPSKYDIKETIQFSGKYTYNPREIRTGEYTSRIMCQSSKTDSRINNLSQQRRENGFENFITQTYLMNNHPDIAAAAEKNCFAIAVMAAIQDYTDYVFTGDQMAGIFSNLSSSLTTGGALDYSFINKALEVVGISDLSVVIDRNFDNSDYTLLWSNETEYNTHYQLGDSKGNLLFDPWGSDLLEGAKNVKLDRAIHFTKKEGGVQ